MMAMLAGGPPAQGSRPVPVLRSLLVLQRPNAVVHDALAFPPGRRLWVGAGEKFR